MTDGDRPAPSLEAIEQPEGPGNREMGWGSDVLAEVIRRIGFKYISITPGASYRGLHDSLVNYLGNHDPKMLLCLHEESTVAIAHGWAKVTDSAMAVALHSNVGLMHAVMAIHNAWCDRAPMFIIGATGNVDASRRRPWIEWIHTTRDQAAIVRHNLKWDDQPASLRAATESFLRAAQITQTAPRGPVYVCLDVALQEDPLAEEPVLPDAERYRAAAAQPVSAGAVDEAAALLLGARRPVIAMGRAARSRQGWDARVRLAETLNAGVITNSLSAAAFPTRHPLHVGWPEARPSEVQKEFLAAADVILNLDLIDFAGTLRTVWPDDRITAKVINCSLDPHNHNGFSMDYQGLAPSDVALLAEPDAAVPALLEAIEARGGRDLPSQVPERPPGAERVAPQSAGSITLRDLAGHFAVAAAGRQVCLTRLPFGWPTDGFDLKGPLDYLGRDGGAGVGSAPGIAVGAALALRGSDRLPVAIIGDGEYVMGLTALWTAARYRIPLLVIVANNRSFFNDEIHQERMALARGRPVENKWIGMRMDDPPLDLAGLARDQGLEGIGPVADCRDLPAALTDGIAAVGLGRTMVIDVAVAPGDR